MINRANLKIGDIYLTKFSPSVGREYQKIRPALVIQDETIQSNYISVLPMTSNLSKEVLPNVLIFKDEKNRLEKDSVIIVQQISSFDPSRFIKKIGEASSPILRQVRGYLRRHFKL